MTRKRRPSRRSRRTQRSGAQRSGAQRSGQRGGAQRIGAQPIPDDPCKGIPYSINGMEYTSQNTREQMQKDCKSLYYVSTVRSPPFSVVGKFMIMKNPEKALVVVNKWSALLQPISASIVGSSIGDIATRTNVNPFYSYYEQLQTYKKILDNKSALSTLSGSSLAKGLTTGLMTMGNSVDSEVFYSDENIIETFHSINAQYNYYKGIKFNMKDFLGFESIGGWTSTEASRKKAKDKIEVEVDKLAGPKVYDKDEEIKRKQARQTEMEKEQALKIRASKAVLVLTLYVFCYLNYMPIPKGNDQDTINRMIQTLNTFYGQINGFSVGGTPKEVEALLQKYVDGFEKNLNELTKEMGKKTAMVGGAGTGPLRGKVTSSTKNKIPLGTRPRAVVTQSLELVGKIFRKKENKKDNKKGIEIPSSNVSIKDERKEAETKEQDEDNDYDEKSFEIRKLEEDNEVETEGNVEGLIKQQDAAAQVKKEYGAPQVSVTNDDTYLGEAPTSTIGKNEEPSSSAVEEAKSATAEAEAAKKKQNAAKAVEKEKEHISSTWNRLQSEQKKENSPLSKMLAASNYAKTQAYATADTREIEKLAKEYSPKFMTIPVEKKSDDYKIADEKLKKAFETYQNEKNNTHAQIVTAEYKKLLDIAKKDMETAVPEKVSEKQEIVSTLQKDFDHWLDIKDKKNDVTTFDPDKVDADIVALKISMKQIDEEVQEMKIKLGITKDDTVFDALTQAIEKEGDAKFNVTKTSSILEVATKTLDVKKLQQDESTNEGKEWKKAQEEQDKAATELAEDVKKVEDAVAALKVRIPDKDVMIDQFVKLLKEKADKAGKIKQLEASSELQRGFLSDTLSYEKTIAYLYRPKDIRDPLQPFYDAIQKGGDIDTLYSMTRDPTKLDGNENVSNEDLKTFVQANEKENNMRARTHFFMKVLYSFAKDLQKSIQHAEMTGFGMNVREAEVSKFDKNRLKEMREYLKERVRSETLFSLYPKSKVVRSQVSGQTGGANKTQVEVPAPSNSSNVYQKDNELDKYKFIRLYNSDEYKQASAMFSLKEAHLEHVFDNTAYFKDRGFVFIKDPAKYMGLFVKYYYDEDDYTNGATLSKPEFEETEVKEPKKAYEEIGGVTTLDKVGKTLEGMNYAGTGTSTQLMKETFETDKETGYGLKSTKTIANAISKTGTAIYTGKAMRGMFRKNKEKASQALAEKQEEQLRKQQIMDVQQTGGAQAEQKKTIMNKAGKLAGQAIGGITGVVVGIGALVWAPFSLVTNIIINAGIITLYPVGKPLFILFDQTKLFDSSSYKSLGKLATTKQAECKKIVDLLAMNCNQEEDQRSNQLLLSVLSNVYNAVDYIQNAEEKFRDRHSYEINTFKNYIENLVSNIKAAPVEFGTGTLYQSMNDPKKMLYFVYAILQKCNPKPLAEVKEELVKDVVKPTEVLQAKIKKLESKKTELVEEIKTLREKTPTINSPVTRGTVANPAIAEKEKRKEVLEREIEDLESQKVKAENEEDIKKKTREIDKEITEDLKTSAESLKKDEKPIKELLSKTPPIVFDMKEVYPIFEKPVTYLYKRYNAMEGKKTIETNKKVNLMPGVDILVPSSLPALASVFLYRTDVKDPVELAKEAEAKVEADKVSAQIAQNAKLRNDRLIAEANLKAAKIMQNAKTQNKNRDRIVPRGPQVGKVANKTPVKEKEVNEPKENKPRTNVTKKLGNAVKSGRNTANNATLKVSDKRTDLLGNKEIEVSIEGPAGPKRYGVRKKDGKLVIAPKPG